MFLLVPAHPGRPGQRATKRFVCVCALCQVVILSLINGMRSRDLERSKLSKFEKNLNS